MPITADDLLADNGSWVYRTPKLQYRVMAGNAVPLLPFLDSLVGRSDAIVDAARAHANSTPYATDIHDGSGIAADWMHIHDAVTYTVWFHLVGTPHRCLAVKFVGDSPVDVFCDEP